ncbi:MAG: MmgE/PrpD family protein [Candidatus Tectomicrobia bacterium]|uniref:MmgE/PrpD family protein n=1 Tax=Tectimicrobiota bacterium TaxID=2528274 RepID=A0A937VY00_UNCTE|nr:MmgE/PrpD family protein [Candidatus Tectomicrobia bacterium]
MASLSRQLAQWVAGLRYDDLPPAVVDRAKGVTLHSLASVLLGSQTSSGQQAVQLMTAEEAGVRRGASIMVDGTLVTKGGAAFANAEMAMAGGKLDSFRMLTHPGTSILPGAFVAAETAGASGREFLTGVAAGYEVMERLAADVIPTVMSRGFHAGPVFGIFGAAIAAAKIQRLTEEQVHSTIALCVHLAGGNLEGPRSGGRALREGAAARNAMLAVALAQQGHVGGETTLEGEAGFYHAYAGNNRGQLTYSFVGDTQTSLAKITAGLGQAWLFLETLYRIYSTAGYNIAHVDVSAQLCAEHNIQYADVERVEAVVNWLETRYPSPAFPSRREDGQARPGGTAYYTAYGVAKRGFPVLKAHIDPAGADDPPEVLDLMHRVTIIPSHTMTLFGPRITVYTKDGKSYTKQSTGREFMWDFTEEARRIRDVIPGLPIPSAQFEEIITTCRDLDRQERADRLMQLTRPPG